MSKKKDWFTPKSYPHIEFPLTPKDHSWVASYVQNPKKISKHSFLPFIHKEIVTRKFRKEYDIRGNALNCGERKASEKKRDIFYASHFDSQIFSYYSSILSTSYEELLAKNGLNKVVTAYRRIPLNSGNSNSRHMCNIDFANEVFEYIRDKSPCPLIAIAFDIKSFFDNLDHKILKQQWAKIIEETNLPTDHYNVYKNITRFAYVNQNDLFNTFKDQIWVESKTGVRRQKKIKKNKHLKNQGAIAYCKKQDFLKNKHLIKSHKVLDNKCKSKRTKGIPQGSSISAILANIYLFDFDKKINEVTEKNGLYRRYSDDIVVVCENHRKDEIIELFSNEIEKYKVEIQPSKTQIFHFFTLDHRYQCFNEISKYNFKQTKQFEYLGFAFDGNYTYLKSSSLATYYRKMKRVVRRHKYYARHTSNKKSNGEIFKKKLFLKYSYKGAQRRRIYRMNKDTNEWHVTNRFDWGNFITYAKLAANNMKNNKINHQIRKHWRILNEEIRK
jgi:hypothetical protein